MQLLQYFFAGFRQPKQVYTIIWKKYFFFPRLEPLAVTFSDHSDGVLRGTSTIRWNPPSFDSPDSCQATNYFVAYQLTDKDQCQNIEDSSIEMYGSVSTTEVTLAGLLPYSTYRVYVTASNIGGDANPSSREIITPTEGKHLC